MTKKSIRECRECGTPLAAGLKASAAFCCADCKRAWNNRRQQRGALALDMVMEMRFNRSKAKEDQIWSILCRMAAQWKAEDDRERGGRQSWQEPAKTMANFPLTTVVMDSAIFDPPKKRGRA